jgi:hypothetical protein
MNTEKLQASEGDPPPSTEIDAAVERGNERRAFWRANFKRLQRAHPGEYVAVNGREVIAHGTSLLYVVGRVEGQGLAPTDTFIEFMATNPRQLLPR